MVLLLKSGTKLSSLRLQMRGGQNSGCFGSGTCLEVPGFLSRGRRRWFLLLGSRLSISYGNYYCQDTEEVQSTQGDSHDGFEIHICKLIPLRKESGQG